MIIDNPFNAQVAFYLDIIVVMYVMIFLNWKDTIND